MGFGKEDVDRGKSNAGGESGGDRSVSDVVKTTEVSFDSRGVARSGRHRDSGTTTTAVPLLKSRNSRATAERIG